MVELGTRNRKFERCAKRVVSSVYRHEENTWRSMDLKDRKKTLFAILKLDCESHEKSTCLILNKNDFFRMD